MKIKGSYFPNEDYAFSDNRDENLPVFVEMLKKRGYYIGDDWHIRSPKGVLSSKLCKNGYYTTMAQFNKKQYIFCEHRVIWCWLKGPIPKGMVVNHIDYNRANNNISNLELMTPAENVAYSRKNMIGKQVGSKSARAQLTDQQAQAIKTLGNVCGWPEKAIATLTNVMPNNVSRICGGKRYPNVIEAKDLMSIYPIVVDFTRNKGIGKLKEIINYTFGLAGECGEVCDLVKKALFHGKELQPVEFILELGDILYYLCAICNVLNIDISDIMLNNNAKLMQRYSNGYSIEASLNRIEDKKPTNKQ